MDTQSGLAGAVSGSFVREDQLNDISEGYCRLRRPAASCVWHQLQKLSHCAEQSRAWGADYLQGASFSASCYCLSPFQSCTPLQISPASQQATLRPAHRLRQYRLHATFTGRRAKRTPSQAPASVLVATKISEYPWTDLQHTLAPTLHQASNFLLVICPEMFHGVHILRHLMLQEVGLRLCHRSDVSLIAHARPFFRAQWGCVLPEECRTLAESLISWQGPRKLSIALDF